MKTAPDKPLRAAIYVRCSTTMQRDEGISIEHQEERCQAWAAAKGATVVETYRDEAKSGASRKRPAYRRMIEDMKAGRFDVIVALKLDRLSRDMHAFLELGELADRCNVDLVCTTQPFDTTNPMGRLMRNLLATFAQFERELIAERVRESMRAAAAKGRHLGGKTPIGYRLLPNKGGLEPDPATAPLILEAFRAYADGRNCHDMVRWFSDRGHPLSHTGIGKLLSNPVYRGMYRWGDDVFSGTHKPIVPKGVWEQVQARIRALAPKRDGRRNTKKTYPYLLDGLITCGLCGAAVTTSSGTGARGQIYYYYRCSGTMKGRGCKAHQMPAEALDRFVFEHVRGAALDPALLRAAMDVQSAAEAEAIIDQEEQRKQLAADREVVQARIDQLLNHAANGEWDAANSRELELAVEKRRMERDSIDRRMALLTDDVRQSSAIARLYRDPEAILGCLAEMVKRADPNRLADSRPWIRSLVSRIILHPDRVQVFLPLAGAPVESELPPGEFAPSRGGGPSTGSGELRVCWGFVRTRGMRVIIARADPIEKPKGVCHG